MSDAPSSSWNMPPGDAKYAPGSGHGRSPEGSPLGVLEIVTLLHVGILVIGTTWAFGGQAAAYQIYQIAWGSLSLLITLTGIQNREAWREGRMRPLRWLWPFAGFNALVVLGSFNPSFREIVVGNEILLAHDGAYPWLPSAARPVLALKSLWLFDTLYLSCFNLALVVRQRRALRTLLLVIVANAFALAIFGTAQKLVHAPGLFFGAVRSPQKFFFSSFIYHNHWGAFTVLMMAACLALVWHHARRSDGRNFFHTPAFGGLVALLVMAASVPMSMSRSCTMLAALLLAAALTHSLVRVIRRRRRFKESVVPPLLGAVVAVALGAGAVWYVARDSILTRLDKTREQIAEMKERGTVGDRSVLYRNTWKMAQSKPWFGWGMASYPHVFRIYNTRQSVDRLPVFYEDAHSDWLQSLAEHGFIGSALMALCALLPLRGLTRRRLAGSIPAYLLGGCGLVLLYAWIEFPFGNIAVVLVWWLCFFSAVQYARLQAEQESLPDAAP